MSREELPLTRRRFLVVTGALTAAPAVGGCMGGPDVLTQDFDVTLSDHPDLAIVGKTVLIDVGLSLPLAVTLREPQSFVVTGTECTHQGCEINRSGAGWRCPCHGAEFALDGSVRRGPARSPLPNYDWMLDGDTLTIEGMA